MDILVSVALITYNQKEYIEKAMDSILMQKTNFPFDLAVGDDCSTDGTRDILLNYKQQYPQKINLLLNEVNLGATKNFYNVVTSCKGTYIATIEGDDYWTDPNKLQKQVDFLRNYPQFIAVGHRNDRIDKNGNVTKKAKYSLKHPYHVYTYEYFLNNGFMFHMGTLMYKNIYKEKPADKYSILYTSSNLVGDLTISLILFNRSDIAVLNQTMSIHRLVIESSGSSAHSLQHNNLYLSITKSLHQLDDLEIYLQRPLDKRRVYLLGCLTLDLLTGKKKMPIDSLKKLYHSVPFSVRTAAMLYPLRRVLEWPVRQIRKHSIKN